MAALKDYRVCLKKDEDEIWFTIKCESKAGLRDCGECKDFLANGYHIELAIHVKTQEDEENDELF